MIRLLISICFVFAFTSTAFSQQTGTYWGAGAGQLAKELRAKQDPNIYETDDAQIHLRKLEALMTENLDQKIKILDARKSTGFSENLLYFLGVIERVHVLEIKIDGTKLDVNLKVLKDKGFVSISRHIRTDLPNGNLHVQHIPLGHYSLQEISN